VGRWRIEGSRGTKCDYLSARLQFFLGALDFYIRRGIPLSITFGKLKTKFVFCPLCFLGFGLLRRLARYYYFFSNLVIIFSLALNQKQDNSSRSKKGKSFLRFELKAKTAKLPRDISGLKWALVVLSILSLIFLFVLDNTIVVDI
jgi:hypothetical protein